MSDKDLTLKNYLGAEPGNTLTWDEGEKSIAPPQDDAFQGASLSRSGKPLAPARHPDDRQGLAGTAPAAKQKPISADELLAQANSLLGQHQAQHTASLARGPSTGVRDDAGGKLPDWLVQAGGSDERRSQAYRGPDKSLKMSPEQIQEYLKTYRGPPGHT